MTLALKLDNVIPFPTQTKKNTSLYKSNGVRKASAAEPIRRPEDIAAMQNYYLEHNQRRNYTIFTLGILFGIRAGDLCTLKIHNIMSDIGRFKTHCDLYEQKTGKFNNPAITEAARALLTDYLQELGDYTMDDYLFRSRQRDENGNYRPITIQQLNNVIKAAAKACGVPGHISSHSLRKTFAYQLLKQNPDNDEAKFALQKMLNHNDFATTLTYCGLMQDSLDKYRAGLDTVLTI